MISLVETESRSPSINLPVGQFRDSAEEYLAAAKSFSVRIEFYSADHASVDEIARSHREEYLKARFRVIQYAHVLPAASILLATILAVDDLVTEAWDHWDRTGVGIGGPSWQEMGGNVRRLETLAGITCPDMSWRWSGYKSPKEWMSISKSPAKSKNTFGNWRKRHPGAVEDRPGAKDKDVRVQYAFAKHVMKVPQADLQDVFDCRGT